MGQDVTTATRYPQSMALMEEMKSICGSYNKASKKLGVPWSTVAMITSGRKPMPIAMAVKCAILLGRDPLLTLAQIEEEHTAGWIREVWREVIGHPSRRFV